MPGAIAKITRNFQVTLPKYLRTFLGLNEGDLVSFDFERGGKVTLTPLQVTKKEQAYYWTTKNQRAIAAAMTDYKKGRVRRFDSVKGARKHFGA